MRATAFSSCSIADVVAVACEMNYLELACKSGTIRVKTVEYGRREFKVCPYGHDVWGREPIYDDKMCGDSRINRAWFTFVSNRCNNRRACMVFASSWIAGDPCPTVYKYATVTFTCVASRARTELPSCLPSGENCRRPFTPYGKPLGCCR
jgi:hypothetical protein